MFSNILLPLDGSELGERALPKAENLARFHNASMHLIHVVPWQPELEGARRGLFAAISAQAAEHQLREARHYSDDQRMLGTPNHEKEVWSKLSTN